MDDFHGGCLCGAVRYEARSPQLSAVCHCRSCQKQSGSAFSVVVLVPPSAVTISGELATFVDRGETGSVVLRRFCPKCGSPIVSESPGSPLIAVKAGTLDASAMPPPTVEIFCSSSQSWLPTIDGTARYARAMT